MAKRVAIIGAGVAGLTSIKNALNEGFEPTAYEKDSWFGGIWYYTEDQDRFVAPKSTVFNTTKHYSCFSDFPLPKEAPNYTPRHVFQKYLESYAEKFDLTKKIRFNTEVLKVEKCNDYKDTVRWMVHSAKTDDNGKDNVCMEVYDYVMVCSGVFTKPFVPNIPGMDDFTGRIMHSRSYKSYKPFVEKRVLVVGLGNTAGDIACEVSRHANQVYISIRQGRYVLPRLTGDEIPTKHLSDTRAKQLIPKALQDFLKLRKLKSLYNVKVLGLQPTNGQMPVITNDDLPNRILTGTIIVKDEITSFKWNRMLFKDETELDGIDVVIFATGYDVDIPFLQKPIFDPERASSQLYKNVFPFCYPSLALIGFFFVPASFCPVLEMQARWAVQVFKGNCSLPSLEVMERDSAYREERRRRALMKENQGAGTNSYYLSEGFIGYLDDIASLIGVRPNLWKLFFQDPSLAMKCFFGPTIPAQYRLMGPGAWSGAKRVIEEVEESRLAPLATRKCVETSESSRNSVYYKSAIIRK